MKPCPIHPSGGCWECITAYREMIHRLADGATLHALNNQLAAMAGACAVENRDIYFDALRRFLTIAKSNSHLPK
jgi:hypothetical protein